MYHAPPVPGTPRRSRRLVQLLAAVLATTALLVACGGGGAASGSGSPDSVVVAAAALPTAFAFEGGNPAGYENLEWSTNAHAGLIRNPYVPAQEAGTVTQDFFSFEPLLAERYEVSPDNLTFTFTLRRGVMSVAGNELTADDVLWSFERKFGAATSIIPGVQAPVITDPAAQIHKLDDYTVSFTVAKPGYGITLLGLLANLSGTIYDSDLLKQHVTPEDPYAVTWSQDNPNYGYGPYYRDSFTPGEEMVLVANPGHALGEAAIKRITYRVAADPGTRANAVTSGAADVAVQLRPADQKQLLDSGAEHVVTFAETNMFTMMTINTQNPDLAKPAVRQALAYAVPYDQIVDDVYQGRAIRTHGFLNPSAPNYDNSGYTHYEHDPAKALQLLADAGYPNGVTFTLAVSNAVPDVQETSVQIKSYAADAGFTINIDEQPPAEFGQTQGTGTFDAFMWRDFAITQSPQYELGLFFRPDNPTNFGKWDNAPFMSALTAGEEFADPFSPEASAAFRTAEGLAVSEAPFIWIARVQPSNAFSDALQGYANRSDNTIDFSVLSKAAPPA